MGRNLAATLEIAATLADAGVPVTVDPRDVNPPCVLVGPPDIDDGLTMSGNATATWSVQVIGPGPANLDSWAVIDSLVDRVRPLLGPDRESPGVWQYAPDRPFLPCYTLTVTGYVPEEMG